MGAGASGKLGKHQTYAEKFLHDLRTKGFPEILAAKTDAQKLALFNTIQEQVVIINAAMKVQAVIRMNSVRKYALREIEAGRRAESKVGAPPGGDGK